MFFRRPKKEVVEKPIIKCSFCKKNEAIGKVGLINYCSDNVCAEKFHQRAEAKKTKKK